MQIFAHKPKNLSNKPYINGETLRKTLKKAEKSQTKSFKKKTETVNLDIIKPTAKPKSTYTLTSPFVVDTRSQKTVMPKNAEKQTSSKKILTAPQYFTLRKALKKS